MGEFRSQYKVGQYYDVPCVNSRGYFVPVLGSLHRDTELANPNNLHSPATMHWHYDLRFMSKTMIRNAFIMSDGSFHDGLMGSILLDHKTLSGVVLKRLRCVRKLPEFPLRLGGIAKILEPLYQERTIDTERPVCPHKAFDLSGIHPDKDGCVSCPLHGLKWDMQTGKMVSRLEGKDGK